MPKERLVWRCPRCGRNQTEIILPGQADLICEGCDTMFAVIEILIQEGKGTKIG